MPRLLTAPLGSISPTVGGRVEGEGRPVCCVKGSPLLLLRLSLFPPPGSHLVPSEVIIWQHPPPPRVTTSCHMTACKVVTPQENALTSSGCTVQLIRWKHQHLLTCCHTHLSEVSRQDWCTWKMYSDYKILEWLKEKTKKKQYFQSMSCYLQYYSFEETTSPTSSNKTELPDSGEVPLDLHILHMNKAWRPFQKEQTGTHWLLDFSPL